MKTLFVPPQTTLNKNRFTYENSNTERDKKLVKNLKKDLTNAGAFNYYVKRNRVHLKKRFNNSVNLYLYDFTIKLNDTIISCNAIGINYKYLYIFYDNSISKFRIKDIDNIAVLSAVN